MTATATRARACDISRTLGHVLDPAQFPKGAANGWTVIQDGTRVEITLNYNTSDDDRAALEIIREALDARYALSFAPALTEDEYEALGEEFHGCSLITVTRRAPQEAPMPEPTPAADETVTLRIPGRVADFFHSGRPDLHASLDAMDRDVARALLDADERPHGKGGTVHVVTTTPAIAAGFLASLAALADTEFDADDADTKAATAALAFVERCEARGISTTVPADYRMQDPAAQAALDAERAADERKRQEAADRETENAAHRDAFKALPREEQAARTQEVLDAACAVLGFQRADTRAWFTLGPLVGSSDDGRFYMEVRRLADPTAQPALDAARTALQAAGWTVTDYGTSFFAQAPQEAPTAAEEGPAATPVTVEWTHMVKGHQNGTATVNGTAYRIAHLTRARADRGALGDHLAYAVAGGRTFVARTWGLDDLLTAVARHAGVTGPLAVTQTHSRR